MDKIKSIAKLHKWLIYIFIGGFLVRLVGINFGLPNYFFNSDENEYVSAAEAAVLHVPSPYKTGLPINIFYYILTGFYYLFHFIDSSHISPSFFILARSLSALLSAFSIIFIYIIADTLFSRRVALLSSLALAFFPVDVHIAHYIKEDVYIQFFGILSLVFLAKLQSTCKERYALFSVIAGVLSGSAKLNGFFYAIPIATYLIFLNSSAIPSFKNAFKFNKYKIYLLILIILSGLAYFISTPISFMDSDPSKKYSIAALLDPEHEVTTMSSADDGIPNFIWWPVFLASFGTGYIITPLILFSIIFVFRKKLKILWPYLLFTILYTLVLFLQSQRFDRWITMVTPLYALFLAIFVSEFKSKKFINTLFIIGVFYNFLISLFLSIQLAMQDTRELAVKFITKNIPMSEIVFFHEALDPPKHYLSHLGYEVYDYNCRNKNRLIDLEQQGSVYVVINETFANLASRFDGSEMEHAVTDCSKYIKDHGDIIATFENPLIDNDFFGYDYFVGPATGRYLHFPKTIIVKTFPASKKFTYIYQPDFVYTYAKNMEKSADSLISSTDHTSKIRGPYIPIPAGKYNATIYFDVPEQLSIENKKLLTFSVSLSTNDAPITLDIFSEKQKNTINFETSYPAKIEFPVVFNNEYKIKFNKIVLEQI